MTAVPKRTDFETAYTGQAPWDIGRPQQAFFAVADRITGSVLDAGYGTGENACTLPRMILPSVAKVTGIDFLDEPIQRARRKAAERRDSKGPARTGADARGKGGAVWE